MSAKKRIASFVQVYFSRPASEAAAHINASIKKRIITGFRRRYFEVQVYTKLQRLRRLRSHRFRRKLEEIYGNAVKAQVTKIWNL